MEKYDSEIATGKKVEKRMIKVSVIIPVYNVEKYIEECINSVMGQTLPELEIICVNDGSTDRSLSQIQFFESKDQRVKVVSYSQNKGQSYARNRGLEMATGKYIYFLDADDYIERNAMKELYIMAEKDNLDVIFFDAMQKFETSELKKRFCGWGDSRSGNYNGIKTGREIFKQFVDNSEWLVTPTRFFWRHEFLEYNNLRFFEGIIHEDDLFSFQATMLADRAEFMSESLLIRRYRPGSTMTKKVSIQNFYGYFTVFYYMNKYACENRLTDKEVKKVIQSIYRKTVDLYEQFGSLESITNGFQNEELVNAFYFFKFIQNEKEMNKAVSEEGLNRVKKAEIVYIYGAGIIAKRVYECLIENKILIEGFLVSSLKDNPQILKGHRVIEIEEMKRNGEDVLVVVGVKKGYQPEIIQMLESEKIRYILYNELV